MGEIACQVYIRASANYMKLNSSHFPSCPFGTIILPTSRVIGDTSPGGRTPQQWAQLDHEQ